MRPNYIKTDLTNSEEETNWGVSNKKDLIKIYSLCFHESFEFRTGASSFFVTRVVGGWLYENYRLDCNQLTTTFVPFNN